MHLTPFQAISTLPGETRGMTERTSRNMVALEKNLPHPLAGLKFAYYLCQRKSMKRELSRLRCWLIRLVYAKCDWASDYCIHDMGIFTDEDTAREVARVKSEETGNTWSVKKLPVNAVLCNEPVRYGFYSFPTSDADEFYQNHRTKFKAVLSRDLEELAVVETKLSHLQDSIQGCAKAS